MKKIIKTISGILLITLLCACSTVVGENKTDYSNKTLTGQIAEINGTTVTLNLGKLSKDKSIKSSTGEMQAPQGMPGQMSEGEAPQMTEGEVPEMPDGEMPQMSEGEVPQMPEGEMPAFENGERPEKPQGGMMSQGQKPEMNGSGFDPSQMTEGSQTEMSQGMPDENFDPSQMSGGPHGGMMPGSEQSSKQNVSYKFKLKDDTAVIDLGDMTVSLADGSEGSISDLKVGDVVQIVVDSNNSITSITQYNVSEVEE